jgi:hypothetical protein
VRWATGIVVVVVAAVVDVRSRLVVVVRAMCVDAGAVCVVTRPAICVDAVTALNAIIAVHATKVILVSQRGVSVLSGLSSTIRLGLGLVLFVRDIILYIRYAA